MFSARDSRLAAQIKREDQDRKYDLALAPVKRILKKGAHEGFVNADMPTQIQMTEAALLLFRKHIEDYALQLALEIGEITGNAMRYKIAAEDIWAAIGE